MSPIEINALESNRFGIISGHLLDLQASPETINAEAARLNLDMLMSRLPVDALDRVQTLQTDGHRLMDTLVYYGRPVKEAPEPLNLAPDIAVRESVPEDASAVAEIAKYAFQNYMGHYHADPRLDNTAADAAYIEWAETSIHAPGPDHNILVTLEGEPAGFMTLRAAKASVINAQEGDAPTLDMVLSGVSPKAQGRGIYGILVNASVRKAHALGAGRIIVSTQINNYAVQRVWARQGLSLFAGYYTLHKWYS